MNQRTRVREAVRDLSGAASRLHEALSAIPANAVTGAGYAETVDAIVAALEPAASVERITVPDEHLRAVWGDDFENVRHYLNVDEIVPREVVAARMQGASDEVAVHLSNNYDLYWGPRKERLGTVAHIMALRALRDSGVALDRTVFLTATPDAYIGGEAGAGYVAAADLGRSDKVIQSSLGGPGLITVGYKGMVWARIAITGKAAHGARAHEGRNAIEAMMWVQARIRQMSAEFATRQSPVPILPAEAQGPSITMCRIEGNLHSGFVAPDCALYVDRRLNPGETVAQIRAEFDQLVADARRETGFDVAVTIPHTVEPSYTGPQTALYRSLAANLSEATGMAPQPAVWSHYLGLHYFTDAWDADAISYTPGRIGHDKVDVSPEDDSYDPATLEPTILALALTAYDMAQAASV